MKNELQRWFDQTGSLNQDYKLLFAKKLKSVCSLKGSLYKGRELLNQGLDFHVSSTCGGGEREFVSGLGSWLSCTNEKGSCLGHNM